MNEPAPPLDKINDFVAEIKTHHNTVHKWLFSRERGLDNKPLTAFANECRKRMLKAGALPDYCHGSSQTAFMSREAIHYVRQCMLYDLLDKNINGYNRKEANEFSDEELTAAIYLSSLQDYYEGVMGCTDTEARCRVMNDYDTIDNIVTGLAKEHELAAQEKRAQLGMPDMELPLCKGETKRPGWAIRLREPLTPHITSPAERFLRNNTSDTRGSGDITR